MMMIYCISLHYTGLRREETVVTGGFRGSVDAAGTRESRGVAGTTRYQQAGLQRAACTRQTVQGHDAAK